MLFRSSKGGREKAASSGRGKAPVEAAKKAAKSPEEGGDNPVRSAVAKRRDNDDDSLTLPSVHDEGLSSDDSIPNIPSFEYDHSSESLKSVVICFHCVCVCERER